jgi:hypothetical protein
MKKHLPYTSEELNSFIHDKNHDTFYSHCLVHKANIVLFFRLFRASCVGYIAYGLRIIGII